MEILLNRERRGQAMIEMKRLIAEVSLLDEQMMKLLTVVTSENRALRQQMQATVNQPHQDITAAGHPASAVRPAQAGPSEIVLLGQRKSPKRSFSSPIAEHSGSKRSRSGTLPGSDISKAPLSGGQWKATWTVHTRMDAPPVDDGCKWRKYGKTSYYRCTLARECPGRKKVERCEEDWSILTTIYEDTHSHPFSAAALAKANKTSDAAGMLLSGAATTSDQGEEFRSQNSCNLAATHSVPVVPASALFPVVSPDLAHNMNAGMDQIIHFGAADFIYRTPFELAGSQMHTGAMIGAMQQQHPIPGLFGPQLLADSKMPATAVASNQNAYNFADTQSVPMMPASAPFPARTVDLAYNMSPGVYQSQLGAAYSVYQTPLSLAYQSAGSQSYTGAMLEAMQQEHSRPGPPQVVADSLTAETAPVVEAIDKL